MNIPTMTNAAILLFVILCAYWIQQPLFSQVNLSTAEFLVYVGAIIGALGSVVALMYKQMTATNAARLAEKDAQIAKLDADNEKLETNRDNWRQIGTEATGNLRKAANIKRVSEGREEYPELAAVVAEHSSLPTEEQVEAAKMQTVRAALVKATLDLGLPPRPVDIADKAVDVAERAADVAAGLVKAKVINGELKPKEK